MVAVGCKAGEPYRATFEVPIAQLMMPGLAPLFWASGNLHSVPSIWKCGSVDKPSRFKPLTGGNGPDIKSGRIIEDLVGGFVEKKRASIHHNIAGEKAIQETPDHHQYGNQQTAASGDNSPQT